MRKKEKRLNFKFWFKRKKCFSCIVSEESKIKLQGDEAWEEYQNKIMKENAEAWFNEADKEVEILKSELKQTTWENADGARNEINVTAFLEKMQEDYNKLKKDIREKLDTK